MITYGLNVRPKKQPSFPIPKPRPPPSVFQEEDDDEDAVEREISRQAAKNKSLQKVEEEHKKALEQDPSIFDYDGCYDEMKEKAARPRIQDKTERKSKYIETLMQKAKEREREHEIVSDKKILKERSKDDHLFPDKDKFVTRAYKKQLAERAQWIEEENLRKIREDKEDVTKKIDISEFYFDLNKNVAFGGSTRVEESTKPSKQEKPNGVTENIENNTKIEDAQNSTHAEATTSRAAIEENDPPPETKRKRNENEEETSDKKKDENVQTSQVYKRDEGALASARERYLARKRAKQQSYEI